MAKPVILAVDDDPQVLRAVERDLRRKYARECRALRVDSGEPALDTPDNSLPKSSTRVPAWGWTSSGASSSPTAGRSRSTPGRARRASRSVCR